MILENEKTLHWYYEDYQIDKSDDKNDGFSEWFNAEVLSKVVDEINGIQERFNRFSITKGIKVDQFETKKNKLLQENISNNEEIVIFSDAFDQLKPYYKKKFTDKDGYLVVVYEGKTNYIDNLINQLQSAAIVMPNIGGTCSIDVITLDENNSRYEISFYLKILQSSSPIANVQTHLNVIQAKLSELDASS